MAEDKELSAEEVVALLELEPHPEGGWYRETWRLAAEGGRGAEAPFTISSPPNSSVIGTGSMRRKSALCGCGAGTQPFC